MLRVVLVDDEKLARLGMRQLLAAHPEIQVVGEAARVSAAAELIRAEKPDAVFLDIQMPGASGFELLGQWDAAPKVVFVTAHSEHAARAFDVQAVDYLLKPVHPARLADTVNRLTAACANTADAAPYKRGDRICLRTPERTLVTELAEIAALEAEGDFTRFYIAGKPPLLICRSLGSYEKTLPLPPFARLSRSLIVNLDRIDAAAHPSRNEATLTLRGLPREFVLGRRAVARLKKHTA